MPVMTCSFVAVLVGTTVAQPPGGRRGLGMARMGSLLGLLRIEQVQEELKLTDEQKAKVAPILLIYSENDRSITAEERHMELIYESVGSQDKETLWLKSSGHVVTRDAQRLQVFKACAGFVARIVEAKQGDI